MSRSASALAGLRPLADLQHGVVTLPQAVGHGVSERVVSRLVAEGHWQRVERGLLATSSSPLTFPGRCWAGVLLGGSDARVGVLAAGVLHGLTDAEPDDVTVFVPQDTRPAARPGWVFVRERAGVRSSRSVGSPPRTTVDDTVLDLCANGSPADAVGWVTIAVQRRRTTPDHLGRALGRRNRHPHRALLLGLLADVALGAESPLEMDYLRDVERAHGLPIGKRQEPSPSRPAVRDVWYVELGVLVELDGRLGHTELGRFRDMNRDNEATLDGLRTLRYGSYDLAHHPCQIAAQVALALRQNGWSGTPTRCRRCRAVPDQDWG